jgi:hypothetical protein
MNRKLKRLINAYLYQTAITEKVNLEHNLPLFVPIGADSSKSIGEPKVIAYSVYRESESVITAFTMEVYCIRIFPL